MKFDGILELYCTYVLSAAYNEVMEEVSTIPQQEPAVFRWIGAEGCKQRTTAGLKQVCTHYGIFLLRSGVIQDEDHDWLNDAQLESVIKYEQSVCRLHRYADYLARFINDDVLTITV